MRLIASLLVAISLTPSAVAFQDAQTPLPLELAGSKALPNPPDNKGGWSVLVATRGGVVGRAVSYATATSAGAVTCVGVSGCRSSLDAGAIKALTGFVTKSWPALASALTSVCSDCVQTFVIVNLRDENGKPQLRVVSWDVTTEQKVAPEIRQLFSNLSSTVTRGK